METEKSRTVLIVDDEQYIRESVKELISKWNIETDEAENGAVALDKIKNKTYSLVLLDMKMNEMDGLEFLDEIKKTNVKTPVILITAHPHDERVEKALGHNIALCLVKPIGPGALKKIVSRFIKIE